MGFAMDLATPNPSVQVGSAQNGWPLGVSISSAPHPPHMSGRRTLSSSIIARLALLVSSRPGQQAIGDKRYLKEALDRRLSEAAKNLLSSANLARAVLRHRVLVVEINSVAERVGWTMVQLLQSAVICKNETLSFQIAHHQLRPVTLPLRAVCFPEQLNFGFCATLASEYYSSYFSELANRRGTSRLPVKT